MTSWCSRYCYEKLSENQIRILTVLPGQFGEAIWVRLHTAELNTHRLIADASEATLGHVLKTEDGTSDSSSHQYGDGYHYEALSYAWGSKTLSHRIVCEDGSYIEVTRSLYQALQYLRYAHNDRRMWVDAVCINQTNLEERAAQVSIMSSIFRSARRVLVWLGEAEPDDTLAFAVLHTNDTRDSFWKGGDGRIGVETLIERVLVREPWCPCCKTSLAKDPAGVDDGYLAVDNLTSRQWFARVWVYQELACAKTVEVHCGNHHRDWVSVENLLSLPYIRTGPSDIKIVSICRSMASKSFDATALLRLLILFRGKECAEQQDRIFGIRSIASLEDFDSLKPDYTLEASEVYRRTVVESLCNQECAWQESDRWTTYWNHVGILGLPLPHISLFLALAGTSSMNSLDPNNSNGGGNRPSWVPAFDELSERADAKYYEYSWHLGPRFLSHREPPEGARWEYTSKSPRSGQLRFELKPSTPKVLRIFGYRFGSVARVLEQSESPYGYDIIHDILEKGSSLRAVFIEWVSRCRWFVSSFADLSVKSLKGLLYCIDLQSGFEGELYNLLMRDWSTAEGEDDNERVLDWILSEFIEDPLGEDLRMMRYYDPFRNLCTITTQNGVRLGWIPQSARPGDLVCSFLGCPRPFVLRQVENEQFVLLGDSWILGLPDDFSFTIPESEMEWFSLT